eukprot:Cvel_16982.t1-p1 / transcript=Cvel_16982.t1 / gene=Cvel_16982 / organism=Chromera_velia_CCMP2878 / gene_product=hypothetical protein / transcript_product=hypothetical protein / location=Cvel_scaffold1334:1-255(-) / protein_length=69 / sequence_SO=supercontig / SO=protein_coding / is_pseudo=false
MPWKVFAQLCGIIPGKEKAKVKEAVDAYLRAGFRKLQTAEEAAGAGGYVVVFEFRLMDRSLHMLLRCVP